MGEAYSHAEAAIFHMFCGLTMSKVHTVAQIDR